MYELSQLELGLSTFKASIFLWMGEENLCNREQGRIKDFHVGLKSGSETFRYFLFK